MAHAASAACPQSVRAVRISRNQRAAVKGNAELRVNDDFREGIAAFLEKRRPLSLTLLVLTKCFCHPDRLFTLRRNGAVGLRHSIPPAVFTRSFAYG